MSILRETTKSDSVIHFKAIFRGTELNTSSDVIWISKMSLLPK